MSFNFQFVFYRPQDDPTVNEVFSQVSQSQPNFIAPAALISFKKRMTLEQMLEMSQV